MKAALSTYWQSRSPRDRAVLLVVAILAVGCLYLALVLSAHRVLPPLRARVLSLRGDAARIDQLAGEVERLRAVRPPAPSSSDLRTLVQAQVDRGGLAAALVRIDAPDPDRAQVVFGAVAFRDWLDLIAALSTQNVRLETCRVEALAKPGLVSATATFARANRP